MNIDIKAEYRDHAGGYSDDEKKAETLAILDYLDVRAAQENGKVKS